MREGVLLCREEAWADFEESMAEGRVLTISVKMSTPGGCGPLEGRSGFQCGEEEAALGSLRRCRGLPCGRIKCGARRGVGNKDERRGRGRVRRGGAGALMGVQRQGLKFAQRKTKQGLEPRRAKD